MHPKIVPSFWSDADFERFDGAELVEIRLTFLWAVTSPSTDAVGIFPPAMRRFALETGLDGKALPRAMEALPKAFLIDPISGKVLIRNYIRYQYGVGANLAKNNMARTLRRVAEMSPETLRRAIYDLHPELKPFTSPSQGLSNPFPDQSYQTSEREPDHAHGPENGSQIASPTQGLTKGPATATAPLSHLTSPQQHGGAGGGIDVTPPTVEECIAAGARLNLSERECRAFHAHFEGLGWHHNGSPLRKPLSWLTKWKSRAEERRHSNRGRGEPASRRPDKTPDDIRAALQTEKNPQKRAVLERQLGELEAAS